MAPTWMAEGLTQGQKEDEMRLAEARMTLPAVSVIGGLVVAGCILIASGCNHGNPAYPRLIGTYQEVIK